MKKVTQLNIGFNKVVTFKEIRKLKGKSVCDIANQLSVNYKLLIHQLREKNPKLLDELVKGYKSKLFPVKVLKPGSRAFDRAAKQCTPIGGIKGCTRRTREEQDNDGS